MSRYRCRRCLDRPPLPLSSGLGRSVICGHCGSVMERRRWLLHGARLLAGTAMLGLSLVVFPEAIENVAVLTSRTPGLSQLASRLDPPPERDRRPLSLLEGDLLERLSEADLTWIPKTEPIAGGGIRYLYRRRLGEPPPSLAQLKAMVIHPPNHIVERAAIATLLQELQRVGVAIEMEGTRKRGAAGEWDHSRRTIRLQPVVAQKGSVEFFRVLNHEAIHVAQSCAGGGLRARPRPLGLATAMHPELARQLDDPMYATSSPLERKLEREAYANQHRLGLGADLVRRRCRPHPALAMWRINSRHLPA
jgi:hypothetical protein